MCGTLFFKRIPKYFVYFPPLELTQTLCQMKIAPPPIFVLLVLLSTSSCGTLLLSSEKEIMMVSSPDAAEVWVDGARVGTTPMQLELNNRTSHNIVFKKEGYSDMSCQLNSTVHGGIVVLDVLAGLVPVIVDAATGGWKRIPEDSCTVTLPSDNG